MTVRNMTFEDIDAVTAIERECITSPWNENGFLSFLLQEGTVFLVAEENGEIVGHGGFVSAADEADITNVAVTAARRKQGIGNSLVARLVSEAETRGIRKLFLEVRESNNAAIRLYHKQGFEPVGRRKGYYEEPAEDAVLMRRDLGGTAAGL